MSEYGKRSAPVAAKLDLEIMERWRARARNLIDHPTSGTPPANDDDKMARQPHPVALAEAAAEEAQRRGAQRQKTLIGAKVVFNDMMSTYDCVIRDLSETGARVKLNHSVQVPNAFMLRFSDGRIKHCKVKRRMALELGVAFID